MVRAAVSRPNSAGRRRAQPDGHPEHHLALGATSETIEVSGVAATIDTTSAQLQTTYDSRFSQDLGIQFCRRNWRRGAEPFLVESGCHAMRVRWNESDRLWAASGPTTTTSPSKVSITITRP